MDKTANKALSNYFNKNTDRKNNKKKIDPATLKEGGKEGRLKAMEYYSRKLKENPDSRWRRKQLQEHFDYYKKQEKK